MRPEITLIKKSGPNPVMSKRIFLDEQGKVCSDGSQCLMAHGTATRATTETAADLAKHIMDCGTEQAIALGALRADLASPAKITTLAKLKDNPGAITRSRDFINFARGRRRGRSSTSTPRICLPTSPLASKRLVVCGMRF